MNCLNQRTPSVSYTFPSTSQGRGRSHRIRQSPGKQTYTIEHNPASLAIETRQRRDLPMSDSDVPRDHWYNPQQEDGGEHHISDAGALRFFNRLIASRRRHQIGVLHRQSVIRCPTGSLSDFPPADFRGRLWRAAHAFVRVGDNPPRSRLRSRPVYSRIVGWKGCFSLANGLWHGEALFPSGG